MDPITLKVYGTENLRVVDASLMPMLIAAHLQRTVYAIAERVSVVHHLCIAVPHCSSAMSQASDIIRG